jgi:hypothetical protein
MPRTRRALLATSVAALAGLAGCAGGSDDDTDPEGGGEQTESPSTTAAAPGDPSDLSFAASVARQPSADAPARIDAALSNDGDAPVVLELTADFFGRFQRTFPRVVLVPVGDDPDVEQAAGCQRVRVDADGGPGESSPRELPAGDSVEASYDVYTRERADECFPDGAYAISEEVAVRGADSVDLDLVFRIQDGSVAVADDGTSVSA